MRDPAQFLEKSLSEHGMTVDSVSHERQNTNHAETFYVHKTIGGERYSQMFSITDEAIFQESFEKQLAMHAQQIARAFEDEMVEDISFGHRRLRVCPYDEAWAQCCHCGSRVEIERRMAPMMFSQDAELSTPQPSPRSFESLVEHLSTEQRVTLKLYLLGKLRTECDHNCENSRHYRKI